MHRQIMTETVLILLLGAYGWTMTREKVREERREASVIGSNLQLAIGPRYSGFDVDGRRVMPAASANVDRVVTFLLHADGLMSDLAIWHEVALHLANHRGVRLVAFCDGSRCAADVAAFADSLEFPVLVYGEVIDAQAVLNADFLGQCLVQKTDTEAFGAKWRDAGLTPAQISQRILQ